MYNLLPEQQKGELKSEYRFRVAVVALRFMILIVFIAGALLTPSFVLLYSKRSDLENQIASSQNLEQEAKKTETSDSTKQLDEEISVLKNVDTKTHGEELLLTVINAKPKNIRLNKTVFTMNGASSTVVVEGVAKSVDDLLALKKVLLTIPPFKTAQFPVELLTKHSDIPFAMTLQ